MKKKFGFVLAAAILLAGCGQKKETTTTTARPVKTTIVESRSIIRKDFSGIVEAVEYVKLAFRVNGQIIQLPVIEGQKVKKGELICEFDLEDIKADGYVMTTPVVISNNEEYASIALNHIGECNVGEEILTIYK